MVLSRETSNMYNSVSFKLSHINSRVLNLCIQQRMFVSCVTTTTFKLSRSPKF
jgi:hypothetical protein